MKTKPRHSLIVPVAIGLWLLAIAATGYSFYIARHAEAIRQVNEARRVDLAKSAQVAEARHTALQQELAKIASAKTSAATAAASKPVPPSAPDEAVFLSRDPELLALFVRSFRAGLNERYGLIYQTLQLPPEQVEKLNDVFAHQQQQRFEIRAAARIHGLSDSSPEIQAMQQQVVEQSNRAKIDLLGEEGAARFDEAYRSQPLAGAVNDVASYLAFSSTPLTGPQKADLLQILGQASQHEKLKDGGISEQISGLAIPATLNPELAMEKARAILSPAQLEALKTQMKMWEAMRLKAQFDQQSGINPTRS